MIDITQNNIGEHSSLKYLPLRKIVHIGGVVVPMIAVIYGNVYAICLVLSFMFMFLFMELLKVKTQAKTQTQTQIPVVFRQLWNENEYKGFATDPFLYFISILTLLLLSFYFDERICYASIVVLTIGDGVSTVVGVHGKRYIGNSKKTVEGTIAGIIMATVIAFPFVGALAFVGSAAGMIIEAASKRFDNVTVPVAAFISMLVTKTVIG